MSDAHASETNGSEPAAPLSPAEAERLEKADRLADLIVEQLAKVIESAIETKQPLELDPHRGQLFELFVAAEAAGLVEDTHPRPLASGELHRRLGNRWGLGELLEQAEGDQSSLPPGDRDRLLRLWSLTRMWMEWTYAWRRWAEFHLDGRTVLEK